MNVPDGQALAAIAAMGGVIVAIGRPIVNAYTRNMDKQVDANVKSVELRDELLKKHVTEQTTIMQTVLQEQRTHDELSCQSHKESCQALKDICSALAVIHKNGTGGK